MSKKRKRVTRVVQFDPEVDAPLVEKVDEAIRGRPLNTDDVISVVHRSLGRQYSKRLIRDALRHLIESNPDIKFSL